MLIRPQNYAEGLSNVRARIARATMDAGRNVDSVTLLAVSKGHATAAIAALAQHGVVHFGENYLNEALPKLAELAAHGLTWHFTGQLQTNKTRPIAERFDWVHGVDRLKIAERLSMQRPAAARALNVCVQVNVGGEVGKGGVAPAALVPLARAVHQLPRLALRGVMCLPPAEEDPVRQRYWFALAHEASLAMAEAGLPCDTLSMGMSSDLEAAIAEGATLLRIGTALFGARPADR